MEGQATKQGMEKVVAGSVASGAAGPLLLEFSKPYEFEGKTYKNIDLGGLKNVRAGDMIEINKMMERSGAVSVLPEMSLQYACIMAYKVTDQPLEFFEGLLPAEAMKLKNLVTNFLFNGD